MPMLLPFPLRRTDLYPIALFLICILAFFLNEQYYQLFEFDRSSLEQGQLWRLLTSHMLHTNHLHLLLNLAALALLFLLHRRYYYRYEFPLLMFIAAIIVSVGVYYSSPELQRYVGMSGVLHALFIWGAIQDIKQKDHTGYLLLAGVLIKVGYEQLFGASEQLANMIDANVAIDAHLWGIIAGIIYVISTDFFFVTKKNKAL
ncbi:rhombosortase [Thalassotalea sp. PP2-459]|uniref:rhombosortase n=1 Tax=Thalassotalea sp. PP2-459 TaxID=1742724 RepID=UPI000942955D|nr:rhombosortase [Thalassotalea sp. PP2-459]OKY25557.1 rhombosortase [Thalassotalea sp. PP2-459]